MSEGICFRHNKKPFQITLNIRLINKLPRNISNELSSKSNYEIKSSAQDENIQSFVNYLQDENSTLDINSNNVHDFYELSREFEDNELKRSIDEEFHDTLQSLFLKNVKISKNGDISESEKFISEHLDEFIQNHANDMYQMPITSLYNIFYYKGRQLTDDLGYRFIMKKLTSIDDDCKNTQSLFILLDSLDYSKLSEEAIKDCLLNKDDHYGFIPKIDFSLIETMTNKLIEFESTLNKIKESHKEFFDSQRQNEVNIAKIQEKAISILKNEFQAKIGKLEVIIEELSESQKKTQEYNRKLEEQIKKLNIEMENIRSTLSETERKAKEENCKLAAEIAHLNNIISESPCNHDSLINQNASLGSNISNQKIEISNINNEIIKDLNQKLENQQKSIDELWSEDEKRRHILENPEEVCIEMRYQILKDQQETLTLPFCMQKIPDSSFSNCKSLKNVEIPSSVTSIGSFAFEGCSSLISITIPSSVASIGNYAFNECASLSNVTIPSTVSSIGDCAFLRCSSLSSIVIPSSVIYIREYAFSGCSSLSSIVIPSSVIYIRDYAFSGCSSLSSITIPSSVESIGDYAFNECTSLSNVIIPSTVSYIGNCAFFRCSSLSSISIPSSIACIREYTFSGCSSLLNVTIPSSVTHIEKYAFCGCSLLLNITIPSSVTCIGGCAFFRCLLLTNVIIPTSVTFIGKYAFGGCPSLSSVTIPSCFDLQALGIHS